MSDIDIIAILPICSLVLISMGMLLLDLFNERQGRLVWTVAACLTAWVFSFYQLPPPETALSGNALAGTSFTGLALNGAVYVDAFSWAFMSIILLGAAVTFMLGHKLLPAQRAHSGIDVDILMILAVCGGIVMVSAAHLMLMFVGFELLSIPLYVLAGIARSERASSEGALKYFILGAFSSAFLLYGIVLVYGATGSMNLADIALVASADNSLMLVGIGLMIFGFGFKVSLVPFHAWTPDVYQGSPVNVTTFMAVVVKAAAFGAFLRIMYVAFGSSIEAWSGLLWVLAVLTMTVGNIVALRQTSIKRMLAYSSIAHAGYALMGFLAFGEAQGAEATTFYMFAYAMMTAAAFGVVLLITAGSSSQYANDDLESLSGIGWTHPFLGFVMTVAMLSLAGMPPFAGFLGKFYLFSAVVKTGYVGLAIIAALNSVVSLYYYLRVLVVMYFKTEREVDWLPPTEFTFASLLALALLTFGTVYCGIFGEGLLRTVGIAFETVG